MNDCSEFEDAKELISIDLTKDQKELIAKVTGISFSELSVLKMSGSGARRFNPALISADAVVMCW